MPPPVTRKELDAFKSEFEAFRIEFYAFKMKSEFNNIRSEERLSALETSDKEHRRSNLDIIRTQARIEANQITTKEAVDKQSEVIHRHQASIADAFKILVDKIDKVNGDITKTVTDLSVQVGKIQVKE